MACLVYALHAHIYIDVLACPVHIRDGCADNVVAVVVVAVVVVVVACVPAIYDVTRLCRVMHPVPRACFIHACAWRMAGRPVLPSCHIEYLL